MKNKILMPLCLITLASTVHSYSLTKHKSLRPLAMGNAYTALAIDKEALHFNPAGLAMMNLVGNYNKRPDLGYLPRNFFDARTSFGLAGQGPSINDMLKGYRFFGNHSKTFDALSGDTSGNPASILAKDSTMYNDLMFLDRRVWGVIPRLDLELAMPHFGGTIWFDGKVEPFLDAGIITPGIGVRSTEAQLVSEADLAFGATENLFWGVGFKFVWGERKTDIEVGMDNAAHFQDSVNRWAKELVTKWGSASSVTKQTGVALDFGGMYQWKRDVRLGTSLQDVFLGDYMDSTVTPDWSVGLGYSPRRLQKNGNYSRAVNFGLDFQDLLNADRNYKFLSKVNFGVEVEQVVMAIPYASWASDLRLLKLRGGMGFKGGYWSLGGGAELLRVVTLEFATWAEERGYVTGQNGERYYAFNIGIGL